MARPAHLLAVTLAALSVAGCGSGSNVPEPAVACDDAAFRAQDEELYVAQATVANALGGGGDPATLLLDLRRARAALSTYLDDHVPCDVRLQEIAAVEREVIDRLDEAVAALDDAADARSPLVQARDGLASAQQALGAAP